MDSGGGYSVARWLWAWLGGICVVGTFLLPMPVAHGSSTPAEVTTGTISWGLKASFRSYVTGPIAHGAIKASSPASDDGTRTTFAQASGEWAEGAADVATSGSVRFTGHSGELDLTISDPQLVVSGSGGKLVIDAVDSEGKKHSNLVVASLNLTGAITTSTTSVTLTKAKATLTSAGTALFALDGAAFYPAGTELDPVSATFALKPGPGESSSPTASVSSTPTVPATPSTTPSATSTPKPSASVSEPAPIKAKAGYLTWGVKSSFRTYVVGPIAKGAVSTSGGASAVAGGFRFGQSKTTADPPTSTGDTTYAGTVRFTGHHGRLDLAFSAPIVRVKSSSKAVLSVRVSGFGRVDLATVSLSAARRSTAAGTLTYTSAPVILTAAGSKVFSYAGSSFYQPGTVMDQLSFRIGAAATSGGGESTASSYVSASSSTSASPAPSAASASTAAKCPASAAQLSWGFKESFRAYVTGSIANGDWSTSGNASYQTPNFSWKQGAGEYDRDTGTGQLQFSGAVSFTGHHGALDTVVSDPVIRFTGPTRAVVLIDFANTSMEDALAGKAKQTKTSAVPFVELDLANGATQQDGDQIKISSAPAKLTAEGAAVFSNYSAGTAFDPVTIELLAPACEAVASASQPAAATALREPSLPAWLGWAGSSLVGALLGSAATVLVARRWLVRP